MSDYQRGRIAAACLAGMLATALICSVVPQAKAGEAVSCESLVDSEGSE